MKIKIPFVGFIEKTINANIVQAFLKVFRDTQDKHRVLMIVPLTMLLSHSYYMFMQSHVAVLLYKIGEDEALWLGLAGFIFLFVLAWAIFSSPFNPALYVRQIVFIIWTGLLHRLAYGLETLGTTYFTAVSFIALTSFLPFAFTGLKIEELFQRLKDDYQAKKNTNSAFIESPHV
jgi:hypothetical protein